MQLDYYLALFQLHVAVIGVVIAGVIALVQLLNAAKPKRSIRLLIRRRELVCYGLLLVGLLLLLAAGSWVSAFPERGTELLGERGVGLFADGLAGFLAVGLMLLSLAWFVLLSLRSRTMLDTQKYLQTYVRKARSADIHAYLRAAYSEDDVKIPKDPFQPVREYIKDNAFKYYDYGTADGLKHFSRLFDKALASSRQQNTKEAEYERLARYISESCEEFFTIFVRTSSEKRKRDTITMLFDKGVALTQGSHDASHASLIRIMHGLESIAKRSDEDGEIVAALTRIRQLSDVFFANHQKHSWEQVAGVFDEICLSVSRIAEDYYLQKNNAFRNVPMTAHKTSGYQTVTAALVDFFRAYRDLSDKYPGATPVYYFEAIESVIEVFFVRLGDIVASDKQHVGLNMKYHDTVRELYSIYFEFGMDAIHDTKPELLAMTLTNLRRVMKPAKNFKLVTERRELCGMFIKLVVMSVHTLGDIVIKSDGRTISDYAYETLHKHATDEHISMAIDSLKKDAKGPDLNSPAVKKLLKRLQSA